jgi:hypothetical protein
MECAGQKNGFVTFKKSSKLKSYDENDDADITPPKSSTVKVPNHIREKMHRMAQATQAKTKNTSEKSKPKGSKEYRSAADKLRAELAEIKRLREANQNR